MLLFGLRIFGLRIFGLRVNVRRDVLRDRCVDTIMGVATIMNA
jgi:hypothetical protein